MSHDNSGQAGDPQFFFGITQTPSVFLTLSQPTMDGIKQTFARCAREKRPAFVAYVTAGYPTADETVDILLGLEAGGAGIPSFLQPFNTAIVLTMQFRSHRARPPLHRPHRRRPHRTKSQHTSPEKWHHSRIDPRDRPQSAKERTTGAGPFHGILQSATELW